MEPLPLLATRADCELRMTGAADFSDVTTDHWLLVEDKVRAEIQSEADQATPMDAWFDGNQLKAKFAQIEQACAFIQMCLDEATPTGGVGVTSIGSVSVSRNMGYLNVDIVKNKWAMNQFGIELQKMKKATGKTLFLGVFG